MTIYCPRVFVTWRMLQLRENGLNIDYMYETDSVLRKTAETEISHLTFWLRFGSVRVFVNRNRTEIRFPHIPIVFSCPLSPVQCSTFTELSSTIRGVSYSLPCKIIAILGPLKNVFLGGKREKILFWPPGQTDHKGTHRYHQNTFLIALSIYSRFSG